MLTPRTIFAHFVPEMGEVHIGFQMSRIERAVHRICPSPPLPPLSLSEQASLHQCRAVVTHSSLKIIPLFIRISLLCKTSQSPLHSLMRIPFPVPLSSFPGGAHVSILKLTIF